MPVGPSDAPPPYSRVDPTTTGYDPGPSHRLQPRNGIPPEHRRSMEDEGRDLPAGWVRQFDSKANHQFFVDTKANPPRSIWHHPYDDDQYLSTLSSEERERLQELTRHSSIHDIVAEDSEDDSHHTDAKGKTGGIPAAPGLATGASAGASSSRPNNNQLPDRPDGKRSWGRKMKDKVTNSTHEEREQQRRQREEEERKAYEQHLEFRRALQKAMETGQPQLVGRDADGKNVYVEPPGGAGGYGYGGGYGVNPYARQQQGQGYHHDPNGRYLRPAQPYARPYGYGYGGGYGLPLAGGLAGGMLLGGMLGGGMGGFGL